MTEFAVSKSSIQFPKHGKWLQSQASGLKLRNYDDAACHIWGEFRAIKTSRMPKKIELPHFGLTQDVKNLENLTDGWLEGAGKAPDHHFLEWIEEEVISNFPPIEYPDIAPTEDGHVVFEWIRPTARIELEFIPDGAMELYSTDLEKGTFVEETFTKGEWAKAFGKIRKLLDA